MSCLYSSPEVTSVDLLALNFSLGLSSSSSLHARHASRAPIRNATQFQTNFAVRRGQQRRAPQQSSGCRRLHQVIPPAKTSTGFSREFSSAISGFRSLLRSEAAQLSKAIALNWTCVLEPFTRGGLSRFENSGLHPQYPFGVSTGPATLDRCCERNVVAPGEYSK